MVHIFLRSRTYYARLVLPSDLRAILDRQVLKRSLGTSVICKADVYNMAKQKRITAWAEIGNKAAHGHWDQYTQNDTQSMPDGVQALFADVL